MKIIANIVALSSLIFYSIGIFSKKNGVTLITFAIGDFIYAMSYILLGEHLTASSFILGILVSIILGYISLKKIKTPIAVYIITEIAEIISFIIFYSSTTEYLVLIANLIFVFFACYDNEILLKYSVLLFSCLLLIYNIINFFPLGIAIECFILIVTIIEIVLYYIKRNKKINQQ